MQNIVQFHKQVFTDSSGAVSGFLGAIFDITEKKRLESALAKLAATDELTGLPNRRDGMARLHAVHKDSERKRRSYCVAMVDIDNFKLLNDQYGHSNGDLVLKGFADLVRRTLRSSDICFRYGGEEFAIVLPETGIEEGYLVVERLRQILAAFKMSISDGQSIMTTVSIGLAQYSPTRNLSYKHLLQVSDNALYDAKSCGRNRTVCVSTL